METASCTQQLVPAVTKITGEPAIVVIGVPSLSQNGTHVDQTSDKKPKSEPKSGSESESDPDFDPRFGQWLKGRKVSKLFGDAYYSGKVARYDAEANWYQIEYEDGDNEDLYWHELEPVLVPLDISIPLKNLALQHCNWGKAISRSVRKRGTTRKDNSTSGTTDIVSGINDLVLVPVKVKGTEQPSVTRSGKRGRPRKHNSTSGATDIGSGINALALVPVQAEHTEQPSVTRSGKRGRKPKGNANFGTNSAKSEENLTVVSVKEEASATVQADIGSGINALALVPVQAEQPSVTRSGKRGRKPKGNANIVSVKEEASVAREQSRRKREVNRQSVMTTAKAERLKRKEQESR